MDKDTLSQYVEQGLSSHKIAKLVGKSQCSVRHWLNKYGLKTKPSYLRKNKDENWITRRCPLCKLEKQRTDFFLKGNRVSHCWCKSCVSIKTVEIQRRMKKEAVDYKGGKCVTCGYDKCQAALEFHHLDPKEKDFSISHHKNKSFENIKKELDKCALLCKNCHAELHFKGKLVGDAGSDPDLRGYKPRR